MICESRFSLSLSEIVPKLLHLSIPVQYNDEAKNQTEVQDPHRGRFLLGKSDPAFNQYFNSNGGTAELPDSGYSDSIHAYRLTVKFRPSKMVATEKSCLRKS